VLQDDTLRSAELVLAELLEKLQERQPPEEEEPLLYQTGSFENEAHESPHWARTWYCLHKYLQNFVRCCLCDFWFCLFWPKGTVGIFATFTLYDEIRSLQKRAEKYESAVSVLPVAGEKRIRCIWCPRRCCKGNADEGTREVTPDILDAAFKTLCEVGYGQGNGKLNSQEDLAMEVRELKSQEDLELLADGLGFCVNLNPVFERPHISVEQAAFVRRLQKWHLENSSPKRRITPDGSSAPLLPSTNYWW